MRIFLLGMMGAGKSYLAKLISSHIPKLKYIDLDLEIEKSQNLSIPQIFNRFGEDYFRSVEHRTLKHIISTEDNFVMATGGGTPAFLNNYDLMYKNGLTIYLFAPVEVLAQRLWAEKNNRPLIAQTQNIEQLKQKLDLLLNLRAKFYQKAHIIWDTSRPYEELIEKLKIFLQCDR